MNHMTELRIDSYISPHTQSVCFQGGVPNLILLGYGWLSPVSQWLMITRLNLANDIVCMYIHTYVQMHTRHWACVSEA